MAEWADGAPQRRQIASSLRVALAAGVALVLGLTDGAAQSLQLRGKIDDGEAAQAASPAAVPAKPREEEEAPAADGSLFASDYAFDDQPADAAEDEALPQPSKPRVIPAPVEEAAAAPEPTGKAPTALEPAAADDSNERTLSDNVRAEPLDDRTITADTDPFAAPGIGVGSFLLRPTLEQGLSWTSNAAGTGPALYSETTARARLDSQWARHSAALSGYGTWREPLSGSAPAEPQAGLDAELRLDLEGPWTANAALGWALAREDAESAVPLPSGASRPIENTYTGALGIERDEGKARLAARLAVTRLAYGDSTLSGGGTLSQEDRNQTYIAATLRGGYEISPAIAPFVEAEIGRRRFDLTVDSAGYQRSATQMALRGGVMLDGGDKLKGDIAAGWLRESFDDSRLAPISGLSLAASLDWSPERETVIGLRGATTVEGTTTAGSSGSLLHSGELTIKRQVRADFALEGAVSAALRDYASSGDSDTILAASAGFTWWLNRYLGVTGRARHEMVRSTIAGRDSDTTTLFLGMTARR